MILSKKKTTPLTHKVNSQYLQTHQSSQLQHWVENKQFAEAEQWLQHLIESRFIPYLLQYATCLAEHDLHQQAEEYLREQLKKYPENIALLRQLAELSQIQGHIMQAIILLKRAINADENNIMLWVQLSNTSLHWMDQQAREAAEKAYELARGLTKNKRYSKHLIQQLQAQAKNALAKVETADQNYQRAETLFQEIIKEHPYFIPSLQGLGNLKMQTGHINEAVKLFEIVKKLDLVQGNIALINIHQFPDDDDTLIKLAQAAYLPSIEGSVKTGILFQLAAVWEKRQQYDKAFEFANQANQASRQFLSYDAKEHRNQSARIRRSFCNALYQHRQGYGVDSTLPIYIVGMPRSGTTLVEQIIAGHSQILGAGELGVIPNVIQGLNRWERHVGSGRNYPDCIDDLTAEVTMGIANNILKELQEYAPAAHYIVDKLPHNFENIGLIKFLFPHAKIISVRRDPRDIAISNYFTDYQAKHGGMGFAYDLTHIGEQLADHHNLMKHWNNLFPHEILEINYESLVDDLEGNARKLLAYIGVNWEDNVLQFNKLKRPVKTASIWQVRQPVYQTSKARWRHYSAYLDLLIKGTNAKIVTQSIKMITLPLPGFLTYGVGYFRENKLNEAELSFKKMLYHNPEHAACGYMLGLVYLRKGYLLEGIEVLEQALAKVPWQLEWRDSLIKAYQVAGMDAKAKVLLSN